jgi:acetyl/propionyl-CoA carboxylase alpha subunit
LAQVRYHATIGAAGGGASPRRVDIEEKDGGLRILLDGVERQIDAVSLEDGSVSLLLDGRSYALEFEQRGDRLGVLVRDSVFEVEVLDERHLRMRAAGGRILVAPGDHVVEGQGLLVMEAMKMENELRATRAGLIREVDVVEGAAVDAGARLCVVA